MAIDTEAFGRVSERIARYIGSWSFIAWMTVAILAWGAWNTLAPEDLRMRADGTMIAVGDARYGDSDGVDDLYQDRPGGPDLRQH